MLKRLLSRLLREMPPGELATDDWAPVPAHAMAQPADTIHWLQEGDGMPRRPEVSFIPVEPILDEPLPDHLTCFSPEEMAVIREQQARGAGLSPAPSGQDVTARGVGQDVTARLPKAAPAPRREQSWVEVLKQCGEHLTDAELQIIRQQLASS